MSWFYYAPAILTGVFPLWALYGYHQGRERGLPALVALTDGTIYGIVASVLAWLSLFYLPDTGGNL